MSGNTRTDWLALKDIKIDSKKYYKGNIEAAWNFLDHNNCSRYRRTHYAWMNMCADEEQKSLWFKLYTKKCERRKKIRNDNVFKMIDKYEMNQFINCCQNEDADPSLTILEYIAKRFGTQSGLIIYSIARKIKAEKMIKKMCTNFITRLYNPHTELGYNYALKNIDWAFD
tara:strand:- start:722 stop:1231 length:510 start_codon:yes stop_codon:yes gene_type:complete